VGTGGTVTGVGNYLRSIYPDIRVHPLEPAESPALSAGRKTGIHRIQGIGDEFIRGTIDLQLLDRVLTVHDGEAILMAQKITRELGMSVGISSGANLAGAIRLQQQLGPAKVVVTIFPDDNKKYHSTDLFKEEPSRETYITNKVRLLSYRALSKV